MTEILDIRVRRPARHEVLLKALRDDLVFPTMRDILLYAAAVGFSQQRRVPFDKSGEPIRYETLTDPLYAEGLVSMLAAAASPGDAEILDPSRLPERIGIFEEFANGGLEFLQEQMNLRHQDATSVVEFLVTEALSEEGTPTSVSVEDLLDAKPW